jgi:hypothetical protein
MDAFARIDLYRDPRGHCALVMPSRRVYACSSLRAAPAVLDTALAIEAPPYRGVDQEAVDIFVGSVLANDAGHNTPPAALLRQLQAAIAASPAWPHATSTSSRRMLKWCSDSGMRA